MRLVRLCEHVHVTEEGWRALERTGLFADCRLVDGRVRVVVADRGVEYLVGDGMVKKMIQPKKKWWERARDAITGRFLRLVDALKRKETSIVERMNRK